MTTEGPLAKLSRLLGLKALAPIPQVKRVEEMPVEFKMAPAPDLMSDTGIHRLYGDRLKRSPRARQYDLSFDYASYRPEGERWICVDLNTYDGAEDSQAPSNFIGHGASEKEARMDLLEQFAEYDNFDSAQQPRPSRVIHSSPFEPPTYADERGEDYDE